MKKECGIKLGDWWLLAIFFVLVAESAYGLFVPSPAPAQVQSADIVFRTSIAAIFGYVISTNFGRKTEVKQTKTTAQGASAIGFASPEGPSANGTQAGKREAELQSAPVAVKPKRHRFHLSNGAQLSLVGVIGLLSLVVLIIWRNSVTPEMEVGTSVVSVLSQFRDMVSGCVGFLIGHPQEQSLNQS